MVDGTNTFSSAPNRSYSKMMLSVPVSECARIGVFLTHEKENGMSISKYMESTLKTGKR